MTLPNFLILGAIKCGTTSLYRYLMEHPQVFMSDPKEPKFFAYEGEDVRFEGPGDREKNRLLVNNIEAYRALFQGVTDQRAIGEATAFYLYLPKAADRIQHYIPRAQFFAILRNPADRAYSAFLHLFRDGREPIHDFSQALEAEPGRIARNFHPVWHYKSVGFYYEQVKRYLERFDRNQLHIYLYEDLKKNPMAIVQEMYQILGVDDSFAPDLSKRYNVGAVPKSFALQSALMKISPVRRGIHRRLPYPLKWRFKLGFERIEGWNRREPPPLNPEVRASLLECYREDISRLQDLLQRDLGHWLN
jgi:hypothetical protein